MNDPVSIVAALTLLGGAFAVSRGRRSKEPSSTNLILAPGVALTEAALVPLALGPRPENRQTGTVN